MNAAVNGAGQPLRILVVIIAHNEADTVAEVIKRVRATVPGASILVVDDGSADATAAVARSAGSHVVTHPFNLGIGAAAQTGHLHTLRGGYDVMVRVDGDGQHPPEDIPRLLETMEREGVNVVIASRFVNGNGSYRPPFLRRLGIRFFAVLLSIFCRQRLTDTTSGFYAADKEACALMSTMNAFDYPEVESIVSMHKAGLQIAEVQCDMSQRAYGQSSINLIRSAYYMARVCLSLVEALAAPVRRNGKRSVVTSEEILSD